MRRQLIQSGEVEPRPVIAYVTRVSDHLVRVTWKSRSETFSCPPREAVARAYRVPVERVSEENPLVRGLYRVAVP